MISILGKVVAIVSAFFLLWLMRTSLPSYDELTGPLPFTATPQAAAATDNLRIELGKPLLSKAVRYKAFGRAYERTTDGVWLIIPVEVQAMRESTQVRGAVWQALDGRRYAASQRVEDATGNLAGKNIQPGLPRRNLLVFELPEDAAHDGVLLLSEQAFPRLAAELRLPYRGGPVSVPTTDLDLDGLHAGR